MPIRSKICTMGAAPASVSAVGHKRVWHDVTNADQIRVRMLWADGREAQFLQSDIKAGLVAVRDEIDRSVVIIRGDGAFATGSAALLPEREVLMGRIADALAQVSGSVLVTGHTDSQPISRSARFPSNWHLSQQRADSVKQMLAANIDPKRLRAEGRAEAEPVESNTTPAGRAKNRRVEITLFVPGGA